MPDYFAGYEIVASTPKVLITCEDDNGARQRAQAVAAACEYERTPIVPQHPKTEWQAGVGGGHASRAGTILADRAAQDQVVEPHVLAVLARRVVRPQTR
ncbi:MAG: hypothetical protein U0Q11_14465 [Vicinamibacterales bacterium]